jgi:hypothetical protein
MKATSVALFVCILAAANAASEHPIEKVINLLRKLQEQVKSEAQEEAVAYNKFEHWCSTSKSTLDDAIASEKETVDELQDKLDGLKEEKTTLDDEIERASDKKADIEAKRVEHQKQRAEGKRLYNHADSQLDKTITAIKSCIRALEDAEDITEGKRKGSMLLAQDHVKMVLSLVSIKTTEEELQQLATFSEQRPKFKAAGDEKKQIDKYDFKSENIIELLKKLKMKFEDEKLNNTIAETDAANEDKLEHKAFVNEKTAISALISKKQRRLASVKTYIEETAKKLKTERKDFDIDTATLKDTTATCRIKASEWDKRSETRQSEIQAMEQAIKILAKAGGVRTEAPGNPIPPANPVSLLQLSDLHLSPDDPKMKAVALLKEAAKDTHSQALERLAVQVAAHLSGPFDDVNNMIEKMIFRLMDEQKQEDEHKDWCDEEIMKTEVMREDKNQKIKDLALEIRLATSKETSLEGRINRTNDDISAIVTFVKEATEIRQIGKRENKLALKDAQDAQTALTNAISVITAFYKDTGKIPKEPWEFIQRTPVTLATDPPTWSDSGAVYEGVAGAGSQPEGILSELEKVLSDFSQMEAQTKSQEAEDQKDYETAINDNKIKKQELEQEREMNTAEIRRLRERMVSLKGQSKNSAAELEKTLAYLKDLMPACGEGKQADANYEKDYEARKSARTKEIEALKKAQITLLDAFKEQKTSRRFMQINSH